MVIMLSLLGVIFFRYHFILGTFYGGNTYQKVSNSITRTTLSNQDLSPSVKLLFVGDMMFDRHIRKMALRHSEDFLFSCIDPLLMKHDIVIGNLEGPITTSPSTSMGTKVGSKENFYFTFPTSTASLLFNHNIKLVSIGNNHIERRRPCWCSGDATRRTERHANHNPHPAACRRWKDAGRNGRWKNCSSRSSPCARSPRMWPVSSRCRDRHDRSRPPRCPDLHCACVKVDKMPWSRHASGAQA